jgi:selenide,water dikinase
MAQASGVTAVVDSAAVPYLDGARDALRRGFVSGGIRRNLSWVFPHLSTSGARGGVAVAGRRADERRPARRRRGARRSVVGEVLARRDYTIEVR